MMMVEMEWLPEQMIAFMDAHGVDKAVLQAGYMEINYCRQYFADAMKRFPGRFMFRRLGPPPSCRGIRKNPSLLP